jgi:maltose O-acetyltransferase
MTKWYLDFTKIGLVQIGNNVFIGTGSIILPNVRIGDNVVIGAGSVVTRDIPDDSLALGNPARVVGKTSEYIERNRQKMKIRPTFDEGWTLAGRITAGQKKQMFCALESGIGYVH